MNNDVRTFIPASGPPPISGLGPLGAGLPGYRCAPALLPVGSIITVGLGGSLLMVSARCNTAA